MDKPLFRLAYILYSNTKLGLCYHKRQVKNARRQFQNGHSAIKPLIFNGLKIFPIPMLVDNYSYLVVATETGSGVVIDPSDPQAVQACIEREGVYLDGILTTHKHWDHSGGNITLKSLYKCRVYGTSMDNIPGLTSPVHDGEELTFGQLRFRVALTPGHTQGHATYILDGKSFGVSDCLFSGDLLFLAGCGQIFEGTADAMLASLDYMSGLADDTLLLPGHEYALENLMFAADLEPKNEAVLLKLDWVNEQRGSRLCTSPSAIGEERTYNPFLRTGSEALHTALGLQWKATDPWEKFRAQILQELRQRKNAFCRHI
uniref:PNKD metallo-beta-lactamase domain containing n=1 Tax=Eptatretus burgeri TaxID=7764 RepID=A0A8C4R0Y2_EPTBU